MQAVCGKCKNPFSGSGGLIHAAGLLEAQGHWRKNTCHNLSKLLRNGDIIYNIYICLCVYVLVLQLVSFKVLRPRLFLDFVSGLSRRHNSFELGTGS